MLRTRLLSLWRTRKQGLSFQPRKRMAAAPKSARPCLEILEDRTLLSASLPLETLPLPSLNPTQLMQQAVHMETTFLHSLQAINPLGGFSNLLASFNPAELTHQTLQLETKSLQSLLGSNPFGGVSTLLASFNPSKLSSQLSQFDTAAFQSLLNLFPFHPTVTPSIQGAPASSPMGSAINLTGSATEQHQLIPHQATFSYAWSVTRDGATYATGNQAKFHFTPDENGNYVVTLTATDRLGRKGTTSKTISVTDAPPTVSITGVPSQAALGTTISASSVVTSPSSAEQQVGFTYNWTVTQAGGNGAVLASGNSASFSYTPTVIGNYVFSLSATDADGETGSAQQTVTVGSGAPSNLILLPPTVLASLQQEAANNTPQWQAFKARLDAELPIVVGSGLSSDPSAYDGSELTWIADYALGYQILKNSDPTTAANYANKAIAVMNSALNDYQLGGQVGEQFLRAATAARRRSLCPTAASSRLLSPSSKRPSRLRRWCAERPTPMRSLTTRHSSRSATPPTAIPIIRRARTGFTAATSPITRSSGCRAPRSRRPVRLTTLPSPVLWRLIASRIP